MKATIKRHIEVTLVLDEEEAKWLRGIMSNALLYPCTTSDIGKDYLSDYVGIRREDEEECEMREALFNILKDQV